MKLTRPRSIGLFLDVGFRRCGVAVFDFRQKKVLRMACIRTEKNDEDSAAKNNFRRCVELVSQIARFASDYHADFVCGELPHGGAKSARAVAQMSMAVAVVGTYCALSGLAFEYVTPNEIKKLVRSKGAVSKEEVQDFVEDTFGLKLPSKVEIREHIADSIACIAVYSQKKGLGIKFRNT